MNSPVPLLELRNVGFGYGNTTVFHGVSFSIIRGERVALVGPSGQGKSTLLRLVAGLETPLEGSIYLNGVLVSSSSSVLVPEKRGLGLVFQDLALFPHLSVGDNIAFGLPRRGTTTTERERMAQLLRIFELDDLLHRTPSALSGGQRQRVAIARSLAPSPQLLMLDEPFANLDLELRQRLLDRLAKIFEAEQTTVLFVTHHHEEAQLLATRVVTMGQWIGGIGGAEGRSTHMR